jgi:uncharacterized damage-inducible protein DinB
MSVRGCYQGWERVQRRLVDGIAEMPPEALNLRASPGYWPVWALAAHLAGARLYWLCGVLEEPGIETTPFSLDDDNGWEDDLDHPRGAREILEALRSSWAIAERCLDTWTEPMLGETFERRWGEVVQVHSRASVLTRLVTHDGYHTGEISLILGMHGQPTLDPWQPPAPPR